MPTTNMHKSHYIYCIKSHLLLLHIIGITLFFKCTSDMHLLDIIKKTIRLCLWFELSVLNCTLIHRLLIHHPHDIQMNASLKYILIAFMNIYHVPGYIAFISQHNNGQSVQLHQCSANIKTKLLSTHRNYLWICCDYLILTDNNWCQIHPFISKYISNLLIYALLSCYGFGEIINELFVYLPILFCYLCYIGHYLCHHPYIYIDNQCTYQHFKTTEYEQLAYNWKSTLLQCITFGEILHNNHHHDPSSIQFAHSKCEIDLTFYIILALQKAGLMRCKRSEFQQTFNIQNIALFAHLLSYLDPFHRAILSRLNCRYYGIMSHESKMIELMSNTDSMLWNNRFDKYCCPFYEMLTINNSDNICASDMRNVCYFLMHKDLFTFESSKLAGLVSLRISSTAAMHFMPPIIKSPYCNNLTCLNFSYCECSMDLLINALRNTKAHCNDCIEELHFDHNMAVNDECVLNLFRYVINDNCLPCLMTLSISDTAITDKTCDIISDYYNKNHLKPRLQFINMENNKYITKHGIRHLYTICNVMNDIDLRFVEIAVNGCDDNAPKCILNQCCVKHEKIFY